MPLTCASGAIVSSSAISAPHPAATTIPVSSSRVAVHGDCAPPARESPNTISVETSAPTNAAGMIAAARPASIAESAATAAPPEIPSTYGSASGLRSRTCSRAPANASSPPTANAASARGRRSSRTIVTAVSVPSPASARMTVAASIGTLPAASATANAASATSANAAVVSSARPGPGGDRAMAAGNGCGRSGKVGCAQSIRGAWRL